METTNSSIKIVRLQSGEDIIADMHQDEEKGIIMLENPMHIIFKRIPSGQTVMMMMPWLPVELIKENYAMIYDSDILTIIEPKDNLIKYYGNIVLETNEKLSQSLDYEEEGEDEEEIEEEEEKVSTKEDIFELLKQRKRNQLH